MQTVQSPVAITRHPLDPLTAEEVEAAADILRAQRHLADTARFVFVTLNEPDKATVLGFQPEQPIDRQAFVILRERAEHKTFEAVVSITAGEGRSWGGGSGGSPALLFQGFVPSQGGGGKRAARPAGQCPA